MIVQSWALQVGNALLSGVDGKVVRIEQQADAELVALQLYNQLGRIVKVVPSSTPYNVKLI